LPPCVGLAFSPDGVQLAAVFDSQLTDTEVVVWDVVKGTATRQRALEKTLRNKAQIAVIYRGPALEWVPDRSGWLLFGYFLVDARSGAVVWTVPGNLEVSVPSHRRLLGRDHLAMAIGTGQNRQLQIITLPRDQINQAAQAAKAGPLPAPVSL